MNIPGNIILLGVGGSHAHGLDHAGSDYDYRGVFSPLTEDFFLVTSKPADHYVTTSDEADYSLYELEKYLRLVTKGNPDAIELLGIDVFVDFDPVWGARLLEEAPSLLGHVPMKAAYLGYARQQFKALKERGDSFSAGMGGRTWKHAKHMFRLLESYEKFARTGVLNPKVDDKHFYVSILPDLTIEQMIELFEIDFKRIDAIKPVGRAHPDMEVADRYLTDYRKGH